MLLGTADARQVPVYDCESQVRAVFQQITFPFIVYLH